MNVDHTSEELIEILKKVLEVNEIKKDIPLHEPEFCQIESDTLSDCINSNFVSTSGEYIEKFEFELKKITGAKNVVSVVNGTSALELALRSIGIKRSEEVFIPALTFVATANAIKYCDAIPHFVDSDVNTLGIDLLKLENYIGNNCQFKNGNLYNKKTDRIISAIMPVHVFGMSIDMEKILNFGKKYNLFVIEDAAEALGSLWREQHLGTFGDVGTLSFNGNKIITSGGGGALLTNNDSLAKKIKHISSTAKIPHQWDYIHDEVGWNYRMPNLNAALGYAQLKKFKNILYKKKLLANKYKLHFQNSKNFSFIDQPKNCESNRWLNCIKIYSKDLSFRNTLLKNLNDFGFRCRPVWKLLNKLPMYKDCPHSDLSNSIKLEKAIISLPSSAFHIKLNLDTKL